MQVNDIQTIDVPSRQLGYGSTDHPATGGTFRTLPDEWSGGLGLPATQLPKRWLVDCPKWRYMIGQADHATSCRKLSSAMFVLTT